ncbi:energy transducer TonB [Temperatibacter marinus]|uniref:Protein TonB n=1 Tax=Temperatibacter marinus TaxID=1456591 RepID=A0AA52H974_9PROT|nr:energy transducer TonB [Temperatibacter marinus]WND02886.1 energy transducer TonB [Temperatibacter marinus]
MIARYASSLIAAVAVTFGLFMLMQFLVADPDLDLKETKKRKSINVIQDIKDQPPQRKERVLEKPPEPEIIEPEIDIPKVANVKPTNISLAPPPSAATGRAGLGNINLGAGADGDYLPLAMQQPVYPNRALERGIEGYCVVRLTVNEDGTVDSNSIELVEEEPKNVFFRASRKAAAKFKYKPRVVNGKGQKVTGVIYKFSFNLAED